MIRIDTIWLVTGLMGMRAGTETALARVVAVFGSATPHCGYLFANRRANRMKVLVHDGVGIWLAARRLNRGRFFWPGVWHGSEVELDAEQLQALVLGLPWQRVGSGGASRCSNSTAMARLPVQLAYQSIVATRPLWQNRRHDFASESRSINPLKNCMSWRRS